MNIIVIGATGGVGQEVVKQALEAGHQVTAYVRNPAGLSLKHERLTVVQGDGLDEAAVVNAIRGQDAVVSCVGSRGLGTTNLMSDITRNVIAGSLQQGVKRIAYVASAGIHKELKGVMGSAMSLLLRKVLADHHRAYELLRDSGLQWTVARPMGLTNGPLTTKYREANTGVPAGGQRISRADVAHFLLKALTEDQYVGQSVGLAD